MVPRGAADDFGKSDLREIFRRIEEESRGHTLCMARLDDEEPAKKIRKAPQAERSGTEQRISLRPDVVSQAFEKMKFKKENQDP